MAHDIVGNGCHHFFDVSLIERGRFSKTSVTGGAAPSWMRGASLPPPAEEARRLRSRRSSSSRRPICGLASSDSRPMISSTSRFLTWLCTRTPCLYTGGSPRPAPLQSPSTVPGEDLELNAPPPNAGEWPEVRPAVKGQGSLAPRLLHRTKSLASCDKSRHPTTESQSETVGVGSPSQTAVTSATNVCVLSLRNGALGCPPCRHPSARAEPP